MVPLEHANAAPRYRLAYRAACAAELVTGLATRTGGVIAWFAIPIAERRCLQLDRQETVAL
jgi:hypothetical protein